MRPSACWETEAVSFDFKGAALPGVAPFSFYDLPAMVLLFATRESRRSPMTLRVWRDVKPGLAMKRDLDLIRALLLKLEELPMRPGGITNVRAGDPRFAVEGYDHDQIAYHLDQIERSGFTDGGTSRAALGLLFRCLTPDGHDYLGADRDPEIWRQTKSRAERAGGWTLGLIKDIGLALIKGELQKYGLPLG